MKLGLRDRGCSPPEAGPRPSEDPGACRMFEELPSVPCCLAARMLCLVMWNQWQTFPQLDLLGDRPLYPGKTCVLRVTGKGSLGAADTGWIRPGWTNFSVLLSIKREVGEISEERVAKRLKERAGDSSQKEWIWHERWACSPHDGCQAWAAIPEQEWRYHVTLEEFNLNREHYQTLRLFRQTISFQWEI